MPTPPAPLPRRHALETAYRLGLVCFPHDRATVTPNWRPLWWALSEFGELDPRLLPHLADADTNRTRLARVGWLSTDRGPGRPAHTLVPTRSGRDALAARPSEAPPWEASSREVARRLIGGILTRATQPLTVSAITDRAIADAAAWGRLVRPDDVRVVLLADRRTGLLRRLPPPPACWRLTAAGYRAMRAIARATGEHLPRHGRAQDAAHDALLAAVTLRLVDACPAMVGALRIARRVRVPGGHGARQRWIVPDALAIVHTETAHTATMHTATGPLVLAVEVERHGRYTNLARHLTHYRHLADYYPGYRFRVLVVSARITPGRHRLVHEATHLDFPDRLNTGLCTLRGVSAQLGAWGITTATRASRFSSPVGNPSEA